MQYTSKVSVWFFMMITLNLFFLAKINNHETLTLTWVMASQLLSLLGVTLLAISFILSGRFRSIENWFGGLDKVYKLHHITGGISFVLLLHHPIFLAVNALPNINLSFKYLWFSSNWSYNYGVIGIYLMMLMLILTLLVNLPYSLWKKTHELMGISLIFASLHILTVISDVSRYMPLRYWILSLLVVSAWSVIYRRFLYGVIGPKYLYVVDSVRRQEDIVEVMVKPVNRAMKFRAGQFAFVNFSNLGEESHPFSIATGSNSEIIRLGIKILGDYTLGVREIKVGDKLHLYGPYGKFYEGAFSKKDLVWIAGGIGITPFLGLLDDELSENKDRKIDLFYCVKSNSEAVFDREIQDKLINNDHIKYWQYCSNDKGRLNAEVVFNSIGNFTNKKFMLCGPVPMMTAMATQLQKMGVKSKDIVFEDFNFK